MNYVVLQSSADVKEIVEKYESRLYAFIMLIGFSEHKKKGCMIKENIRYQKGSKGGDV